MTRKKRRLAKLAVAACTIAALAAGGYYVFDAGEPAPHLKNRPWVTSLPQSPRDNTNVLFLSKDDPVGATVHGSAYRHLINVLQYRLDGNLLALREMQTGKAVRVRVKTWECDEAPGDLDLCLELRVARARAIRLYSSTDWEQPADVEPNLARVAAAAPLPAASDAARERDGQPDFMLRLTGRR